MNISFGLTRRLGSFVLALLVTFAVIYGALPWLTNSVDILHRMSVLLEDQGIDPSRYYYTDVSQVAESENYLRTALDSR
ncbi:MAG: hypothetical protein ACOX4Z_05175 [Desulfobulbus sp.]|jgi:hypothetical protein|nr:hypothetical protein [Desulfobulbaceae bacterium]